MTLMGKGQEGPNKGANPWDFSAKGCSPPPPIGGPLNLSGTAPRPAQVVGMCSPLG